MPNVSGIPLSTADVNEQKNVIMAILRLGSVELSEADIDKFIVWCRLSGKSVRAKLATIIMYYMAKKEKDYRAKLVYTANKYGLSPEETFKRLLNNEELGESLEDFEVELDWADETEGKDVDV
ncbi:hypothetical protein [Mastigocoleus testarum]|nr:hypothetical protein [Mastigocoleus testarum]